MAYIPPPYEVTDGGTGATTASGARTNLGVPATTAVMLLDGTQAMTGSMNVGGFEVTNGATPSSTSSLATKGYVDSVAQGLSPKPSARIATTTTLPAYTYSNGSSGVGATLTASSTGVLTIDGYTTALDDYILVKDEAGANAPYNGLYKVTTAGAVGVAYVLTRAVEMDTTTEFRGAFCFIEGGTANGGTGWVSALTSDPTVGTTDITFTQFNSGSSYTAGNGLQLAGSAFSVLADGSTLTVSGTGVKVSDTYPGNTSLVTLGTVTTGTWNGSVITSTYLPTNVAYNDSTNSWSAAQIPSAGGAIDIGSISKAWRDIYVTDNTDVTHYTKITTTALTGNRTVTLPNADSVTVQPNAGASHNYVTAIGTDGSVSIAQPSSSDLSDVANIVFNNTANTYSGTVLQDFSAAGVTIKTAGGGTSVYGAFTSDTKGNRDLGSTALNFKNLYLGTSSFYTKVTNAALTANRTLTIPNNDSVTVVSSSGSTNQFATGIGTDGVITYASPDSSYISAAVLNKTATYTLLTTDSGKLITVTTSGAGVAINLPAGAAGLTYTVKVKVASTNSIVVHPNGTDKIDNVNSDMTVGIGRSYTYTWDSVGTPNEWVVT